MVNLQQKVRALFAAQGTSAGFAVRLLLGRILPGDPTTVDLVVDIFAYVRCAEPDQLAQEAAHLDPANAEQLARLDDVLEVLLGRELRTVLKQLVVLKGVPQLAVQVLEAALATDSRCRSAAWRLYDLLSRRPQLRKLPLSDFYLVETGYGSEAEILARRMKTQQRLARQVLSPRP